jgi:glycosyltransferase involved in cell wall biosynthesis
MAVISNKITRLMLILQPILPNPNLMSMKIEEISAGMDKDWKIIILSGLPSKYFIENFKLSCPYAINPVPLFGSSKSPFSRIIYLFSCGIKGVKVVKEQNISVITQHDGHIEYGIVAYFISRLTHRKCLIRVNEDTLIPLIYFLKSSGNRFFNSNLIINLVNLTYRKVEHTLLKRADWVTTHGPMDYEQIKQFNSKITFVPLSVDLTLFKRMDQETVAKFRLKFDPNGDKKILLFVGRLHPEKGVPTLFQALKLIENMPVFLVMIYSFSGYKKEYEKLAIELGISDKIAFVGYVPHEKLRDYYNSSDLCILPSLREEWSNTIMESMACQTPVVATNVGGNPYLIVDGKSGFLVPTNDPLSLAQKIKLSLENTQLSKQITDTAYKEIQSYSKDKIGDIYKKAVLNLIKTPKKS